MMYGKAIQICSDINNPKYSDGQRLEAIQKILLMETINAVRKDVLLNIVRWFWDNCVEEEDRQ